MFLEFHSLQGFWIIVPTQAHWSVGVIGTGGGGRQLGQIAKFRQKLNSKIWEIDWSYLCLQQFDKFWIWIACNDRKRKLSEFAETCLEKLKWTYFWWFLAIWNHCGTVGGKIKKWETQPNYKDRWILRVELIHDENFPAVNSGPAEHFQIKWGRNLPPWLE